MPQHSWNHFIGLILFIYSAAHARPITSQNSTIAEITKQKQLVSSQMQPIRLTSIAIEPDATSNERHSFLIQGGLHGNETLTSEFVEWLSHKVQQGQSSLNQLPAGSTIDFLPQANPDAFGISRYNSNRVNLNRNFGVLWGMSTEPHGEQAFSESETQAIRQLMQTRRYLSAVDIHGYINWVVAPSPPQVLRESNNPMNRLYRGWIEEIKNNLKVLPGYRVKKAGLLGDGGSFEDWAFWGNQTMSFCLEMSHPQRLAVSRHSAEQKFDTFEAYESYIHRMFSSAIKLHQQHTQPDSQSIVSKDTATNESSEKKGH
ncbi:MAG: M14 family metallopeptidase [Oligoflexus sp.]